MHGGVMDGGRVLYRELTSLGVIACKFTSLVWYCMAILDIFLSSYFLIIFIIWHEMHSLMHLQFYFNYVC